MSKYRMEIYNAATGVLISYDWLTEERFLRVKTFLRDLAGGPTTNMGKAADAPEFYYFETERQRDELNQFIRKLSRPNAPSGLD